MAWLLKRARHVISLDLNPFGIFSAAWRQVFIADFFTVEVGFIEAQPSRVKTGTGNRLFQGKVLFEQSVLQLFVLIANPLANKRLILLASLKITAARCFC